MGHGQSLGAGWQPCRQGPGCLGLPQRVKSLLIEKLYFKFWPEVSARRLPLRSYLFVLRLLFLKLLQKIVYIRKGEKKREI